MKIYVARCLRGYAGKIDPEIAKDLGIPYEEVDSSYIPEDADVPALKKEWDETRAAELRRQEIDAQARAMFPGYFERSEEKALAHQEYLADLHSDPERPINWTNGSPNDKKTFDLDQFEEDEEEEDNHARG